MIKITLHAIKVYGTEITLKSINIFSLNTLIYLKQLNLLCVKLARSYNDLGEHALLIFFFIKELKHNRLLN